MFQDQIDETVVENLKDNETESNPHSNSHRLNKREVLNATADGKDPFGIVPSSARKRTLNNNRDNRRISVVVHNITSLISEESRLVDDVTVDSTAPSYR